MLINFKNKNTLLLAFTILTTVCAIGYSVLICNLKDRLAIPIISVSYDLKADHFGTELFEVYYTEEDQNLFSYNENQIMTKDAPFFSNRWTNISFERTVDRKFKLQNLRLDFGGNAGKYEIKNVKINGKLVKNFANPENFIGLNQVQIKANGDILEVTSLGKDPYMSFKDLVGNYANKKHTYKYNYLLLAVITVLMFTLIYGLFELFLRFVKPEHLKQLQEEIEQNKKELEEFEKEHGEASGQKSDEANEQKDESESSIDDQQKDPDDQNASNSSNTKEK